MGFNGTAGSRSPTGRVVQASAAMVFGYHASRHCRLACLYFVVTIGALIWIRATSCVNNITIIICIVLLYIIIILSTHVLCT